MNKLERMAYIEANSEDIFFKSKQGLFCYLGRIFKKKYFQFMDIPKRGLSDLKSSLFVFNKDGQKYFKKDIEKYMKTSIKEPTMGI